MHSSMPPKKSASISSIMPTFMAAGDLKKFSVECCGKGHRLETESFFSPNAAFAGRTIRRERRNALISAGDHILESVDAILSPPRHRQAGNSPAAPS